MRVERHATVDAERLSELLKTLASPVRLRILEALREPTRPVHIRLRAGEERGGLSADRVLSRPAIVQHLQILEAAELVRRVGDEGYVIDQATIFSIVQELGGLARIRAVTSLDVGVTREAPPPRAAAPPEGPRLLVVGGPEEGRAFPLSGDGPWTVGRASECSVRIDYDAHVSRLHATIARRRDGALQVTPAPSAKNPLAVDFAPPRDPVTPSTLAPGAVLVVGSSRLVYQP